ncbi:CD3337/EF1877 family mobilome membrane protein [Listeria monocytogenes]|uniref:Conjugal transfer protein n=1 Tax=Listeria monocytogenes TaxID=1639 RepID=A0A612SJC9_LISMN|nr:hypothetical protein [Listeria monocytogenes]EAG6968646.1 hypothetical protein [Listeria monocytogenes]EAG9232476.1 hypothetical protein [Listeria monocytogenes]EAW7210534.1 hypothetical protein [Listeria monocytogenes]ECW1067392.1 hypothetical protein [Listeria monocytogenes]EGC8323857.1 hypothetical protein [Listeria monocytogenes]
MPLKRIKTEQNSPTHIKKHQKILVGLGIFLLTFFTGITVLATTQGGIEILADKYDLDAYQSYMNDEFSLNPFSDKNVGPTLNGLANFFFWLTKLLFSMFDAGIELLYNVDAIDMLIDKISAVSESLWDILYGKLGATLVIIAVLWIFFEYAIKRNGGSAGRKALTLFLVLGISFGWFTHSAEYMRGLNKLSGELQGIVMSAGTKLMGSEDIPKGQEAEGSLALIRNTFFELTVLDPYLLMNYGTVDQAKIEEKDSERIDVLLKNDLTEEGYKAVENYIEANEKDNYYLSTDAYAYKMAVSFISIPGVLILGTPLLLISMVNLLLQLFALGISIILPVSFFVALLPNFGNSAWYSLGRLFGIFFAKIFVSIIILLMFVGIETIVIIAPITSIGTYLLNLILTAIVIYLLIRYRNEIIKFVTAGQVQMMDGGLGGKASNYGNQIIDNLRHLGRGSTEDFDDEDETEEDETEGENPDAEEDNEERNQQEETDENQTEDGEQQEVNEEDDTKEGEEVDDDTTDFDSDEEDELDQTAIEEEDDFDENDFEREPQMDDDDSLEEVDLSEEAGDIDDTSDTIEEAPTDEDIENYTDVDENSVPEKSEDEQEYSGETNNVSDINNASSEDNLYTDDDDKHVPYQERINETGRTVQSDYTDEDNEGMVDE